MANEHIGLSVVIPYYRAPDTISDQLEALTKQTSSGSWEVVISDNESSAELATAVRRYEGRLPRLEIVDSSDRRGEAHARNVGVKAAKGEIIAFCDADDVVGEGWLAAMEEALLEHDFVGARVEFKKLNPPWAARVFENHAQQWGLQQETYPPFLSYAGGGTLGFHRLVHESVGGFDESWPVLTDKDFCFRAQLAGIELHFVPDAVIHYRCRPTLRRLLKQARSFAEYNVQLYKRYRAPSSRGTDPWRHHYRKWTHLAGSLSSIRSNEGRAVWVYQLGWHIGILLGSIRHLVTPPF